MAKDPKETKEPERKLVGGLRLPIEGSLSEEEQRWLEAAMMAGVKHNLLASCEVGSDGSVRFSEEVPGEGDRLTPTKFLTPESLHEVVRTVLARLLPDRSIPEFAPFPEPAARPVVTVQQARKKIGDRLGRLFPFGPSGKSEVQTKGRVEDVRRQQKEHGRAQLESLARSLEPFRGELTRRIREEAAAGGEQKPESRRWKPVNEAKVASGTKCDIQMNFHPSRVEPTRNGIRISVTLDSHAELIVTVRKGESLALKHGLDGLTCTVTDKGAVEFKVAQGGATLRVSELME